MATKKPIPIRFTKFEKLGDHPAVFASIDSPTGFAMVTRENVVHGQHVTPGDWICDGTSNDPYPIKADDFERTYTIVEVIEP